MRVRVPELVGVELRDPCLRPAAKELVEWLAARGWIAADVVADAVERSEDAARDLPLAERLGELLYQQAKRWRPSTMLTDQPG